MSTKTLAKSVFRKYLRCPKCLSTIQTGNRYLICNNCVIKYPIRNGILDFIISDIGNKTSNSLAAYEKIHQSRWSKIDDKSYEIFASFAKGNKVVDIACGDGFIEELEPDAVGVDFSLNALKKAKKRGAKYLVRAEAENLPFKNDCFDLAICAGSLEHFSDPQKALCEMARVAKIQMMTVHRLPQIPYVNHVYTLFSKIFNIKHQPIEQPFTDNKLKKMIYRAKLKIVFSGHWNLPFNYGRVIKFLPEIPQIPSSSFIISVRK